MTISEMLNGAGKMRKEGVRAHYNAPCSHDHLPMAVFIVGPLEPSFGENRSEPLQNRIAIRERINRVICKTSF